MISRRQYLIQNAERRLIPLINFPRIIVLTHSLEGDPLKQSASGTATVQKCKKSNRVVSEFATVWNGWEFFCGKNCFTAHFTVGKDRELRDWWLLLDILKLRWQAQIQNTLWCFSRKVRSSVSANLSAYLYGRVVAICDGKCFYGMAMLQLNTWVAKL